MRKLLSFFFALAVMRSILAALDVRSARETGATWSRPACTGFDAIAGCIRQARERELRSAKRRYSLASWRSLKSNAALTCNTRLLNRFHLF